MWTILFLIWALPSHFQPSYDRLIRIPGSSVSTFFPMRICLPCREGNKSERFEIAFFLERQRAFVCTCVETHVGTLQPTYLCLVRRYSCVIYGISIDVFMNILLSLTLCIYWKQRKVYLLIYWELFMHIAFLWRTETKPTHSCPKEEAVLDFQPGYAVLSFKACVSAFSFGFLLLHLWILCTLLDAPLTWCLNSFYYLILVYRDIRGNCRDFLNTQNFGRQVREKIYIHIFYT